MSEKVKNAINVSQLNKTWVLDIDGTLVKHNGYKIDGKDTFLEGAEAFLKGIPEEDMVVLITSRTDAERALTEAFLDEMGIRFNSIIFNAPYGERILINDRKPSGMNTAIAINPPRDTFMTAEFVQDETI